VSGATAPFNGGNLQEREARHVLDVASQERGPRAALDMTAGRSGCGGKDREHGNWRE
jgi:hypothetical protein